MNYNTKTPLYKQIIDIYVKNKDNGYENLSLKSGEICLFHNCISVYPTYVTMHELDIHKNKHKYVQGVYDITTEIKSIAIGPYTELAFVLPNNSILEYIDNKTENEKYYDCASSEIIRINKFAHKIMKITQNTISKKMPSTYITRPNNSPTKMLEIKHVFEHFKDNTLTNSCHYVCENVNYKLIIMFTIIIAVLCYYFNYMN